MKEAARSLGVTLLVQDIRTGDDLPAAFDAGAKEHAEGLLTTAESIFVVQARTSESNSQPATNCRRFTPIQFKSLTAVA